MRDYYYDKSSEKYLSLTNNFMTFSFFYYDLNEYYN